MLLGAALLLAACGGRDRPEAVKKVEPFEQVRTSLDGGWSGILVLDDGTRLSATRGHTLGPWVCGRFIARDFCVEADRVVTAEYLDWADPAPPNPAAIAVAAVAVGIPAAIIANEDIKSRERSRQEFESAYRQYAEARASVEGSQPLPPTADRLAAFAELSGFARCMGRDVTDLALSDREGLARQVWTEREHCLSSAAAWFREAGEPDKARRLGFIESARERYESVACEGSSDIGLRPPNPLVLGSGDDDWMAEYRSATADAKTYAYSVRHSCRPDPGALSIVMTTFPLTEITPEHLEQSRVPLWAPD